MEAEPAVCGSSVVEEQDRAVGPTSEAAHLTPGYRGLPSSSTVTSGRAPILSGMTLVPMPRDT